MDGWGPENRNCDFMRTKIKKNPVSRYYFVFSFVLCIRFESFLFKDRVVESWNEFVFVMLQIYRGKKDIPKEDNHTREIKNFPAILFKITFDRVSIGIAMLQNPYLRMKTKTIFKFLLYKVWLLSKVWICLNES